MKKIITIFLMIFIILQISISESKAISPSSNEIYEGIDVSSWQGNINFSNVANDGIRVVYIKATQGTNYISPNFESSYKNAKANGLKVGFYHYVMARSVLEAEAEAQYFASKISGKEIDCKLAMDFEEFGSLSKEQINTIGLAFMRRLEQITGKPVIIYSNTYTARTIWDGEILNYPLWVAEYGVSEPGNNGKWSTYVGWQYTDMGVVNGINGYVDRNRFTEDIFINGSGGNSETLPSIDMPTNGYKTIRVVRGDTLSQIAIDYGTTVQELVRINNIQNPNLIYAGTTLQVPITSSGSGGDNPSGEIVYIVKRGDTLSQIAQNYGTTVNSIARRNGIRNVNLIYVGQRLLISSAMENELGHIYYRVVRGDTLYSIARRYNTTIANIVMLNRIQNPNLIYPGQCLRLSR